MTEGAARPKLLYLVTEDWYFWSHRLPVAKAAQAAGFAVAVATRVAGHGERIGALGFTLYPLSWRRRSLGPWASFAAIAEITALYRRERPALVHHVALKPAVLGSIAARLAGVPAVVNAIAGFGFLGGSDRLKARFMRRFLAPWVARLLLGGRNHVIVQNEGDRDFLLALRPQAADRIHLIRGSGVDLEWFQPLPEPALPVTAGFVGRMIAIKGVETLVAAQQKLQRDGIDLSLLLAGGPDPENPSSIAAETLVSWGKLPGITWLGPVEDIRQVWAKAHIAVLPARGEGLPKSLLEAAACGRPMIASDEPGCREIARPGINALLVPFGDTDALAEALRRLAQDPELRERFGTAGRQWVENGFSDHAVAASTVALYQSLTDS